MVSVDELLVGFIDTDEHLASPRVSVPQACRMFPLLILLLPLPLSLVLRLPPDQLVRDSELRLLPFSPARC